MARTAKFSEEYTSNGDMHFSASLIKNGKTIKEFEGHFVKEQNQVQCKIVDNSFKIDTNNTEEFLKKYAEYSNRPSFGENRFDMLVEEFAQMVETQASSGI